MPRAPVKKRTEPRAAVLPGVRRGRADRPEESNARAREAARLDQARHGADPCSPAASRQAACACSSSSSVGPAPRHRCARRAAPPPPPAPRARAHPARREAFPPRPRGAAVHRERRARGWGARARDVSRETRRERVSRARGRRKMITLDISERSPSRGGLEARACASGHAPFAPPVRLRSQRSTRLARAGPRGPPCRSMTLDYER